MNVKVVGITKPLVEGMQTAEELVSYCARVSNPSNQMNFKTSGGLLKYCINHKHFSIFEMVNVVMEIKTTRDIGRQILRHRSFSFQEFSQRYSKASPDLQYREMRVQDTKNRQNSIKQEDDLGFKNMQEEVWDISVDAYIRSLESGVAKEQARALLPEGLTETSMYMNGSLRSWMTYCTVRCGTETQKEHRDIAKECAILLFKNFPFLEEVMGDVLDDNYSAEKE
jgi:thymidylate synthase (FAD)